MTESPMTERLPDIPDDADDLPDARRMWTWHERLAAFGPRLTGTEAHRASLAFLADRFARLGLDVQRDVRRMRRWLPTETALSLADGTIIALAAPYPYSGCTDGRGVQGELVWFDRIPGDFSPARDKIAIIPLNRRDWTPLLVRLLFRRKARLPDHGADFCQRETTPWLSSLISPLPLEKARDAGVLGVIGVFMGLSSAQAQGQVLPFTTGYARCPALWVCEAALPRLKAAAAARMPATLRLEASVDEVTTDTLFAILPGCNRSETVIVNTHTDGPNIVEENGPLALLALAHHHARRPLSQRRRDLTFVMATGHFQLPQLGDGRRQATGAWMKAHPELWDGRPGHVTAVAALTLEHLGCMEWKDDLEKGHPLPTGRIEREAVYTTTPCLEAIYRRVTADRSRLRSLTLSPRTRAVFFGEGQPLALAGIPVMAMVPGPDYLFQILPDHGLSRLDPELFHQQVITFNRVLRLLDRMSRDSIGRRPFPGLESLSRLWPSVLRLSAASPF